MKEGSSIAAFLSAVAAVTLAAGPAIAGEVTGNGKKDDFSQGRSLCKFSGLNDIPEGDEEEGPEGRVQNFGHGDVWADPDSLDPHSGELQFHPGFLCNPNRAGG